MLTSAIALVLACALLLSGPVPPAAGQQKTIRLGYQPGPGMSWVMKERKLLEKRGYRVEWVLFQYAAPELEAMTAGSIDIASAGSLPIVMMGVANPDIWYLSDEAGNVAGMVVGVDSGIKTAADLKGKKIAFPGKGSQQYGLLASYLGRAGVKESDVELFKVNAPDMRVLLQKKDVHGFVAWAPFTSEAVREGIARDLWTADDLHKVKAGHWIGAGWGVRAAFARESPDAVVDFILAKNEAIQLWQSRPEEVYPIFSKASGLPEGALKFMFEKRYWVLYGPEDTIPSREGLKQMLEILSGHKVVRIEKDLDQVLSGFVHPEFVERALLRK
jgi:ABC-type nitrate/sulfonate/bicarbonate transport system substrate-binding protein